MITTTPTVTTPINNVANAFISGFNPSLTRENTQPLVVVYRGGPLALAHNGNLVNARELRREIKKRHKP